jgi:peroxiredoxin (alkyl hydroperoxide reductase subunit C)
MKTYITLTALFLSLNLWAQDKEITRVPLIGERAPEFTAESTTGNIKFPDDYFGKWKILFSHPAAFTPVCTSEILELAYLQDNFKKLNTQIIVLSTDGINSHIEWTKSMQSIAYKGIATPAIKFPLISDVNAEISKKYGMIHPYTSTTKDIRGVYIIDPENKIRAIFFYPNTTGRNIAEIERTLIALQESDATASYTPANWVPGQDLIMKSPATMEESEKLLAKNDPGMYSYAWYFWFFRKEK